MHWACARGQTEVARWLLRHRADIGTAQGNGALPLHLACAQGHVPVARVCIEARADANACPNGPNGVAPIHIACGLGNEEMTRLLCEAAADVNSVAGTDDFTPLLTACARGFFDVVRVLVQYGACIRMPAKKMTPVLAACMNEQLQIVQFLLESGADGTDALRFACSTGNTEAVRLFIGLGVDINSCDDDHGPPLHTASTFGHLAAGLIWRFRV